MMLRRGWLVAVAFCAACGSDSNNTQMDAPGSGSGSGTDAAPATVMTVDCASVTPAATVTAKTFAYLSTPAGANASDSAIKVGDAVEFNLMPSTTHPVIPDPSSGMTDPGIIAKDNAITCLKFTAAGTFHYDCQIHGHGVKGTVTVTP